MAEAPPGIGEAPVPAKAVMSGLGDLLWLFSICLVQLGVSRAEQVALLDRQISEYERFGLASRSTVARSLREILSAPEHPALLSWRVKVPSGFRLIKGGRHGAPKARGRKCNPPPDSPPPAA